MTVNISMTIEYSNAEIYIYIPRVMCLRWSVEWRLCLEHETRMVLPWFCCPASCSVSQWGHYNMYKRTIVNMTCDVYEEEIAWIEKEKKITMM